MTVLRHRATIVAARDELSSVQSVPVGFGLGGLALGAGEVPAAPWRRPPMPTAPSAQLMSGWRQVRCCALPACNALQATTVTRAGIAVSELWLSLRVDEKGT